MAFIDLGKLKFNWQGDWQAATAYEVDDVVFYDNHSFVCTTTHNATGTAPSANLSVWALMAAGVHFREDGDWVGASTYYRYDIVRYNSNIYILTGANDSTNQTPGSAPWSLFQAAPAGNVMNSIGAMEYRNNENATSELVINPTINKGLTVQEQPRQTYPSLAFSYEEDGDYGKSVNTPGSIAAETYTQTVTAQRSGNSYAAGSYIITGSDRNGAITKKHDPNITINIGDTVVFNNSMGAHPIDIRVAAGGAQVTTGTLTGAGAAGTVTWVTTGVAAGTYYYECTSHAGMLGTITVVDTTNPQGSSTGNGTIDVTRGKSYTITFANNLSNGQTYDLYTTAGGHSTANDSVTAAEGNSAFTSTTNSGVAWTTGSTVTITFTPNETTPDVVYIGNRNSAMTNNLVINVHDMAYVPSWGTAAPQQQQGAGTVNNREFTHWQDWYGYGASGIQSGLGYDTTDHQRRPLGEDDSPLESRRVPASPGTASWTVPDNVTRVRITCVGGGGGGGSYNSNYYSGHGGGGGGFTSAEYDVTAGTVLTVTPGKGGFGAHYLSNTGVVYGGGGGTSQVTGTGVNIAANPGQGGGYYNTYAGGGAAAASPSGSGIDSATIIASAGGRGGYGSQQAHGFGSEDYPAGGGGSAGSMYGSGWKGGDGAGGGYSVGHPGGAGIGGPGGFGGSSNTTTPWYDGSSGSGGGSYGPGISGGCGDSSGVHYGYGGAQFAEGGCGAINEPFVNPYTDDKQTHFVRGQNSRQHYALGGVNEAADHSICFGARYGDGEQTGPLAGADDTWTLTDKRRYYMGDLAASVRGVGMTFGTKAFNGVLGRLWGGGGAGHAIKPIEQDVHSSNIAANSAGGCGGSGAGGGGGVWTYNGWGLGNTYDVTSYHVWDPANLAWRVKDSALDNSVYYRSAIGGCGGALGGGGSGGSFWHSGMGGIGGGGGGGAGQHSYSSYSGRAGDGGVGYVLIEWKYDE
jgi:plastocyanin|tara:strand:- start:1231 stop:4131 length:2901 start_codon:yes stop_codon:yes gene_type:complete